MIYYAVFYMKNHHIHLIPHQSKLEAEQTIEEAKQHPKIGANIELARIVKKDPEKEWFKSVNGYWI